MSFTSFEQADDIVDRFINLLHRHGITPTIGKKIEGELLSPLQLLEAAKTLSPLREDPELLSDAGGMYDLAAKVLSVELEPEFNSLVPHLELFKDDADFARAVQTQKHDPYDDTNRKLSDLYIGTLAVHCGHNVQLDHPKNSKGDNPDVMLTIQPVVEGEQQQSSIWTLAIKSISTKSGQTIFENIEKAGKQIDDEKCPADYGMVVINLKGSLDYPRLRAVEFNDLDEAQSALQAQVNNLIGLASKDRPQSDWKTIFAGRTVPIVFYFAHAVVKLRGPNGSVVPTILKVCAIDNPLGRPAPVAQFLAGLLNEFMQTILLGIPGTNGQLPA